MKSMVRPKKITLVASDGKRYALMCKAKDELRKDCRLMDINRVGLVAVFAHFIDKQQLIFVVLRLRNVQNSSRIFSADLARF